MADEASSSPESPCDEGGRKDTRETGANVNNESMLDQQELLDKRASPGLASVSDAPIAASGERLPRPPPPQQQLDSWLLEQAHTITTMTKIVPPQPSPPPPTGSKGHSFPDDASEEFSLADMNAIFTSAAVAAVA